MASKEVAVVEEAKVPALVPTPSFQVDADDIALPKFKLGQYTSDQVKAQLVPPGALYSATSKEDAEPVVLWNPKKRGDNPGVVFYVLDMYKGKSLSDGGELTMWYGEEMANAPKEAWTTYNFVVAIPDADELVPYKWLLTKSGKSTAQTLLTTIKREEGRTPAFAIPFEVTTSERSNAKGEWFVPLVKRIDVEKEADRIEGHAAIVEQLAIMVANREDLIEDSASHTDEPEI